MVYLFQQACSTIRNAVYGIKCETRIKNRMTCSTGTAFMIAPGIVVSAAHLLHLHNNPSGPRHTRFGVIRAPDIGQKLERTQIIAEESVKDIALFQIQNPRSNHCVNLAQNILQLGTSCGSLGFPLAYVDQRGFHLLLRFQGAYISAFNTERHSSGQSISYYETDALMYKGSSGCPGFTTNANVFGLHNRSRVEKPGSESRPQTERLAISLWVPSTDIIAFARDNGVKI